jgi:type I restriction enzyme S subunit
VTIAYKRIDAIAEVIAGQSPPSDTYNQNQDGIPFFQGKADFTEKYPNTRYWCNKPQKIALPNDILMSVRAPVGPVNICPVKACIGRGLSAIRVNNDISFEYVFLFLKNNERRIASLGVGSTFNAITQQDIKSLKIPIPDNKYDQLRVATILNKAEELIAQRKESIMLLDELLRSTFLDMFGDPENNTKGWDKPYLRAFGDISTGNTPPRLNKENYSSNYIEWIKTDNILESEMYVTPALEYLSEFGASKARIVTSGALLVTCIAGSIKSIGGVALTNRTIAFNQQINAIQPYEDVSPLFIYWLFKVSRDYVRNVASKGMKKIITKSTFEDIRMIKPPYDIQAKFNAIVEKVEVLKTRYQTSLAELENLYGSLSQRAFKGELDLSKIEVEIHEDAEPPLEEKLTEKSTEGSPDETRHLRGEREGTVRTPDNLEYVKREIAAKKIKGNLSYPDLKKILEELNYDMKPETKDIQQLMIKLLESESPVLEQIFDYPSPDFSEKQILFRLTDENKKS